MFQIHNRNLKLNNSYVCVCVNNQFIRHKNLSYLRKELSKIKIIYILSNISISK